MARYIDADIMEYDVLHLDVDVAEHKCKDYESYINGANQFRHQVKVALRHTPTADVVEVKHGEWEKVRVVSEEYGFLEVYYQHKDCKISPNELYKCPFEHCPRCGAKMNGGKADNE